MTTLPLVHWTDNGAACSAFWTAENVAPPARLVTIDDRTCADEAYGLACQGIALVWRGDFQNARQLLVALGRRSERQDSRSRAGPADFHRYRQARAQRARTLAMLCVPLDPQYGLGLPRAPDIRAACEEAFGPAPGPTLISLRAVLGLIGAHEWRIKGIEVPAAGGRIHPHYGVFAPIRSEYVDLVATAPLPDSITTGSVAFDIGTGTGVLAAVLARRGIGRVVATDLEQRAVDCARQNIERLGLQDQIEVHQADLFPPGRAALVVCNPPWLPARPTSTLEQAVYDPDSRMLRGFLAGLSAHLQPAAEGWLILSDLAEHLGLRSRAELLAACAAAGLEVRGRLERRSRHPRSRDDSDPFHAARAAEVTSLWRLAPH